MTYPEPDFQAGPSRTSQAVALTRAELTRPHSADGDEDAQRALVAGLTMVPPAWLRPGIEARTRFMDEHVLAAIGAGVRQIVILGAGLDDRALRFRTPQIRFFELDHPVTQADKADRLRALGAGPAGPALVPCDFQSDAVGDVLAACGHASTEPTLFLCEGLLIYLDEPACRRLLAGSAAATAAGSVLAATISIYDSQAPRAEVIAAANAPRRAARSEPWRTILPVDEYLALLAGSGWTVTGCVDSPLPATDVSHGRRSLFVTAVPAGRAG
jgi:methyltransferase (TIGR00027 family)